MERSDHPRVVVIGAGIVGSAIAMHLAERDLRPVLVAPDPAEQTTSARSFGSISAFGTDPVGYYELACTALARWSKWAQRLGEVGFLVLRPQIAVLAAGAESVTVARAVGLDVATLASPGLLVETEPLPAFTDKVVYLPGGPGPQVHLRQRPDGSVLLGERSQEMVAHDLTQRHGQALLSQAARFLPVLRGARIARTLLAWRSMPTDRLPILGPLPGLDGLYLAVTHSGVTLAPVLGPLVAEEIATGEQGRLLAPFRPGRFAERATRVAHDVDELFR